MFQNYLKIAWRNFTRKREYSFINMVGLGVGIAASLIIFLVIHFELSYDSFQSRKDRIYRVVSTYKNKSNGEVTGYQKSVPVLLPETMRLDFPEFEKVVPVWNIGGAQLHVPDPGNGQVDEKVIKGTEGLFFTEPSLFDVFDYSWLEGNAAGLKDPNTVVLTESLAKDLFGDWKKAMGRTIQMWSFRIPLRVVGIFRDLPANTDLQVRMAASYATFRKDKRSPYNNPKAWENMYWSSECYLLLPPNANPAQYRAGLDRFVKKYYPVSANQPDKITSLSLQPLSSVHLDERFGTYKGDALTHKELWALGLVGFFLLLMACINFINLATAQSVTRAREVGVRKVLGSRRSQLVGQFLNETALITFLSVIAGYLLALSAVPLISGLMQKPLSLSITQHPSILLFLVLTGIVVTFLAGFYPGLVLSGFNPSEAIKARLSIGKYKGITLRRALVVLQFVLAQFLIMATIVVVLQMKFFREQSMGFQQKAMVLVELPSDSTDQLQYSYLKNQLLQVPGVAAASLCMNAPADWGSYNRKIYFNNSARPSDFEVNVQLADTSYLNTFQIPLVAGRPLYQNDSSEEWLVNETLARKLGYRNVSDIVGKTLFLNADHQYPIVGVMRDFNTKSLRGQVEPLVLTADPHTYNFIALRLEQDRMTAALDQVQSRFKHIYPGYIYDPTFLDERIASFYHSEQTSAQLFRIAAFLAIFISCLGLYGLVSFMAIQKTKEVGIRKVLGASLQNILYLFSREFTVLILIAFLIAGPLGYLFVHQWLSGFYNHIHPGWEIFLLVVVLSLVVAWLTVGYKSLRAALVNPVQSLRSE